MKLYFLFFILFLFFGKVKCQKKYSSDELLSRDSIVEKTDYYLIAAPDSIFNIIVYKDDVLYMNSYSIKGAKWQWKDIFGQTTFYYKKKKIESTGYLEEGLAQGTWMYFYENGNLRNIIEWENGAYKGSFREYYENGRLKVEGQYDYYEAPFYSPYMSSKTGQWNIYSEDGVLKEIQQYYSGEPIKRKVVNVSDYQIDSFTVSDDYFDNIETLKDGSIDDSKFERSIKHGIWKFLDESGAVIKTELYNMGTLKESGVPPQEPDDQ